MNKITAIFSLLGSKIRTLAFDVAILHVPNEVEQALKINAKQLSFQLGNLPSALDWESLLAMASPTSQELFSLPTGQRLPCWLPGDEQLGDDWLLSENYYPYYFRIYKHLGSLFAQPKLLEFGVRSGYSGVVFAKAISGEKTYVGVDPNLYVSQGLEKAAQTFELLRTEGHRFTTFLIEGFSSSEAVKKTLSFSGPYHAIHIDGEHTYFGKVYDLYIASQLVAPGGFVLVDDCEHHGMIHEAVKLACYLGWFNAYSFVPTKRGLAVLQKK